MLEMRKVFFGRFAPQQMLREQEPQVFVSRSTVRDCKARRSSRRAVSAQSKEIPFCVVAELCWSVASAVSGEGDLVTSLARRSPLLVSSGGKLTCSTGICQTKNQKGKKK